MGTYEELKAAIQQVIRTNGNNEITGALLQNALLSIVNVVGANATFAGIATPNTNPGTADQNVFYLATEAGMYVNFGGIVINKGEAVILSNKTGNWVKTTSGFATQQQLTELEYESGIGKGYTLLKTKASGNELSLVFKKGLSYYVRVKFQEIKGQVQIGTLNANKQYINSTPIYKNVNEVGFTFKADEDSNTFFVYATPTLGIYDIEIALLDVVRKPTFNGLLNPETTPNAFVIQPIKSIFFFVEQSYIDKEFVLAVAGYKDNKVQIHISSPDSGVFLVYSEDAQEQPKGLKHYKGMFGYGGKVAYIDLWFDWNLYVQPLWTSTSEVYVKAYPVGGSVFNVLFGNIITEENNAFQTLVRENVIDKFEGSSTRGRFYVNIKKGVRYVANVEFDGVSECFQIGSLLNSTTYIDASPILSNVENYTFDFVATQDAPMFIVYSSTNLNMRFSLVEYLQSIPMLEESINKLEQKSVNKGNTICIASFDGLSNDVFVAEGWSEVKNGGLNNRPYFARSATSTPFADAAKLDKYFTISNRKIVWDIDVTSDTKVCAFTQGAELESLFEQGYCVVVDFSAKTFAIHKKYGVSGKGISETLPAVLMSTNFNAIIDNKSLFRIVMERVDRTLKATLTYLRTNEVLAELQTSFENEVVPSYGLGYDIPAITPLKGTLAIYSAKLLAPQAKTCFLYIVGDSITEGVPTPQAKCWAYRIADIIPNTIVSGRGGGNIDGVLRKIQDEASVLKPTYIMVTIGTNGGNTPTNLAKLVADIKAIGAIPIINTIYCSSTNIKADINAQILALGEKCVRMDVATALNNNLADGADSSLFVSDGTHLNEQGNEMCFRQVKVDMPELF